MQEAEAILPFMASGADGVPAPDVEIDYMFSDVPLEELGRTLGAH